MESYVVSVDMRTICLFYDKAYFPSKFVPFLSLFQGESLHSFYNDLQSFNMADT
jgi:hypothetical protein